MSIRAILLDYGGVLMRTVDPRPRRELERRLALRPFDADRLVFEHPLWDQAQLGQVNPDAVWSDLAQQLGLNQQALAAFRERFWAGDRLDEDLVRLIKDLRAGGYRASLLSNNVANLQERVGELLPDVFDEIVISACKGVMKPDPLMFELALAQLGVSATEAVLVDDHRGNVEAAVKQGLHAVHFRGLAPLRRDLRLLGVPITDPALTAIADVRAVIFDWGGVLERLPDADHFSRWEQRLQLMPGTPQEVLWGEQYRLLEAGEVTMAEFARRMADGLDLASVEEARAFIEGFYPHEWLIEETLACVRALRGRYLVALLSDAAAGQDASISERYGIDVHAEFDVYISSAETGIRKPDPAIFELALTRLGVEPAQAILVDDSLRNVDAARVLGIHTIQFVEAGSSLAELNALLGEPALGDTRVRAVNILVSSQEQG